MSERSGLRMVDLSVLEVLDTLAAYPHPGWLVRSFRCMGACARYS
jgi:hypothetical protein